MNAAKVLIVDDEKNMRATLSQILREEGHDVRVADCGEAAVEVCAHESFDVILMDVRMPGMNGVEAFRQIRRRCAAARVILMSAYTVDELQKRALEEGAVAFLKKPLNVESVVKLIAGVKDTAILIVEHDLESAALVQNALRDRGYRVSVTSLPHEALELSEQIRFDIVFIDLALPSMNGLDLYLALKRISPSVLAIMITGLDPGCDQLAQEALRRTAYSVLRKPLNIDAVLGLLRRIGEQRISGDIRKPAPNI